MTIKKCLLTTPLEERKYDANMPAEDVALVLGVSKTTVLKEERKALAKAKRILKAKGYNAEVFFNN